jgi:hypothetical protein
MKLSLKKEVKVIASALAGVISGEKGNKKVQRAIDKSAKKLVKKIGKIKKKTKHTKVKTTEINTITSSTEAMRTNRCTKFDFGKGAGTARCKRRWILTNGLPHMPMQDWWIRTDQS